MNERIKLPAQEWLGYDPEKGDIHGYTPEQMRAFAELIIKECIDACYKANEIRNIVPPLQEQVVLWCIGEIEKKFGVK